MNINYHKLCLEEIYSNPEKSIEVNNEQIKEVNTNRKVVENRNVEMRVEKKQEVKVNKKKAGVYLSAFFEKWRYIWKSNRSEEW